ncbi:putative ribonuclease H-like domain-containing protein [Tanacetum coccineum]
MDEIVESENMDVTTFVTPINVKKVVSNHKSAGVKNNGDAVEPKTIRENSFRPPVIKDWNSDDDSEVEFIPNVEDKTVRPSIEKIKFVKSTREIVEKYIYLYLASMHSLQDVSLRKLDNTGQFAESILRKDNILQVVDLKRVVPTKGLTCLFAKATIDESNLWHRRLGHTNFKNMNKLVRGNLVRGELNTNRGLPRIFRLTQVPTIFGLKQRSERRLLAISYTQSRERILMAYSLLTAFYDNVLFGINSINTVSTPVSTVGPSCTNDDLSSPVNAAKASNAFKEHLFEQFSPFKNAFTLPPVSNVTLMNDTGIFSNAYDDEDVGAEADLNNLETTMNVSPIPTTRIDKDHPKD